MQNFGQQQSTGRMDPIVRFYSDTKENKHAGLKEGRPIFDDIEMVKITFPADRQRTLVKPAHASAMVRDERGKRSRRVNGKQVSYAELYREQYKAYKANQGPVVHGTPLSEAPFLSEGQRKSLKALEVYTIEQLSNISSPKSLGMGGMELVNKAKAYLANAAGTADVTSLAAKNARLEGEIAEMREEMARLAEARHGEAMTNPGSAADDPYEGFSDEELKADIMARGGKIGPGRQSRGRLVATLEEIGKT